MERYEIWYDGKINIKGYKALRNGCLIEKGKL